MILPADLDLERPDADIVAELVASGAYDEDEARAVVEILRDPDGEPVD